MVEELELITESTTRSAMPLPRSKLPLTTEVEFKNRSSFMLPTSTFPDRTENEVLSIKIEPSEVMLFTKLGATLLITKAELTIKRPFFPKKLKVGAVI